MNIEGYLWFTWKDTRITESYVMPHGREPIGKEMFICNDHPTKIEVVLADGTKIIAEKDRLYEWEIGTRRCETPV